MSLIQTRGNLLSISKFNFQKNLNNLQPPDLAYIIKYQAEHILEISLGSVEPKVHGSCRSFKHKSSVFVACVTVV